MTYIELKSAGKVPKRVTSDDSFHPVQGTRDGAMFTAGWLQAKAQEGRVFVANSSKVTAVTTFGAGSISSDEIDLMVSVPAATTIIPIEIRVKMEAFGNTAIFECMASTGTGGALSTTASDYTAITPTNLRTDAPYTSACTIAAAHDSGTPTYMTANITEFWRDGLMQAWTQTSASAGTTYIPQTFVWNALREGVFPICVGASQLAIFAASQAGTGFITLIYVEIPSADLN